MIFSEIELELLDVAYKHFSTPQIRGRLRMLRKDKFRETGMGFENWFQIELIYAIETTKGLNAKIKGKKEKKCDLIVNNIGLELKSSKKGTWSHLRPAFDKHADLYMFLMWQKPLWKTLNRYLDRNGYIKQVKELKEPGWVVTIIKKEKS